MALRPLKQWFMVVKHDYERVKNKKFSSPGLEGHQCSQQTVVGGFQIKLFTRLSIFLGSLVASEIKIDDRNSD